MFGIAGTMGTIGAFGRPEGLVFGVVCWGGAAEDGVVGWVEKASDGGCDVEGVSRLRGWCSDSSVGGGASVVGIAIFATLSSSAADSLREGSSTGALGDCGAGVLLRRGARGGKAPSNDCQGRGG